MTEYRTPSGRRAWYARTPLGLRQHLTLGMFEDSTACGHPATATSNRPLRTPVGMTCRWCVRRVTRHGTARRAPLVYPWFVLAYGYEAWEWLRKRLKRKRGGS